MSSSRIPVHVSPSPLGSAPLRTGWPDEPPSAGEIAAAITTQIVGLLRQHTGRGPTKAKAFVSSDLVVVTLADCLTTAERQLVSDGEGELVVDLRGAIHRGVRSDASSIVEELTGKRVTAFLTAQHDEPDFAVLVFFLGS